MSALPVAANDTAPVAPRTLEQLATEWIAAKANEQMAVEARRRLDVEIVALTLPKDEGTVTTKAGALKVKVGFKLTRSVDTELLQDAWSALTEHQRTAFRWKADIDTKNLRALQDMRADEYAALSAYITIKPASPFVTVEEA